jgi:hypothetical protein
VSHDPLDYPFWLASRSAGVVAYLLLSGSVVLGLVMAARLAPVKARAACARSTSGSRCSRSARSGPTGAGNARYFATTSSPTRMSSPPWWPPPPERCTSVATQ